MVLLLAPVVACMLGVLSTTHRSLWCAIGVFALAVAVPPLFGTQYSDSGHEVQATIGLIAFVVVPAGIGRLGGAMVARRASADAQRST